MNDLSGEPQFKNNLLELRSKLKQHLVEMNDLSLYPESYMIENALGDPLAFSNSKNEEIKSLVEIADLAVLPFESKN